MRKKKQIKVKREKINEVVSLVKKLQQLTGKKVVFKEAEYDPYEPEEDEDENDQDDIDFYNSLSDEDFFDNESDNDDIEIDQPNSPFQNSRFRDDDF